MSWGVPGKGKWMTVYTNPGHAFLVVAGLRLDTGYRNWNRRAARASPGRGPRWGKPRSARRLHGPAPRRALAAPARR